MPGLFGFVDRASPVAASPVAASSEASQNLLQAMAKAIQLEDFQQRELYHAAGVGLGCVHIPLMNPEPQPVWNAEHTICLIWYGEIFEPARLFDKLAGAGVNPENLSQAQLLLQLYETFGTSFANQLNGNFVIAIWREREQELLLINDFLGAQLLYYAQYNNRFAFASLANTLLVDPTLPRQIDKIAIAEFLTWEMVLGERTFLQNIQLLPPGTILKVKNGQVSSETYWRLQFAEEYSLRPRQEYFDEFAHLLKQSIQRQSPGSHRVGVNLSGGLDSRTVLGLTMTVASPQQNRSFTFGLPNSDDVRLAAELAKVAETEHHVHKFEPDFLVNIVEKGVRLSDGMSNSVHFHAMTMVHEQSQLVDLLYTGYMGDTILSSEAPMEWIVPYDRQLTRRLCEDLMGYVFVGQEQSQLFTPDFFALTHAAVDADTDRVIDDYRSNLTMSAVNHFEMLYNGRRNTRYGNDLLRNYLLCRNPFCDKDFVEFCMTIPPGLRINRTLVRQTIADHFHSLAKIPWDKTGLPLVECLREYRERLLQQVRWHTGTLTGFKQLKERKSHPMHNYALWMRGPLRPWVEATLLTGNALERGYIRPNVQRQLVSEHMAGKDNARELGLLISLELWHRLFME